jgi:hypothetical protein
MEKRLITYSDHIKLLYTIIGDFPDMFMNYTKHLNLLEEQNL